MNGKRHWTSTGREDFSHRPRQIWVKRIPHEKLLPEEYRLNQGWYAAPSLRREDRIAIALVEDCQEMRVLSSTTFDTFRPQPTGRNDPVALCATRWFGRADCPRWQQQSRSIIIHGPASGERLRVERTVTNGVGGSLTRAQRNMSTQGEQVSRCT